VKFRRGCDLLCKEVSDNLYAELAAVNVVPEKEKARWNQFWSHSPENFLEADEILKVTV
jgi:hypothetical protein